MLSIYDTIVIGNDLSSLIAAEASSREGLKTLLLKEVDIPDTYSQSGFNFNIDPFPWSGLGSTHLSIHPYLDEKFFQPNRASLRLLNPGLQIILPSHRVDIYWEIDRYIGDLEREFPGSTNFLHDIYEAAWRTSHALAMLALENPDFRMPGIRKAPRFLRLMASLYREHMKFLKKMRAVHNDSLLSLFLSQFFFLAGSYHPHQKCLPVTAPYALFLPLQGFYYPLGGKHLILQSIKRRFLSQGGDYAAGCTINKIGAESGKCELEWVAETETLNVSSKRLVVSSKWKNLAKHFSGDRRLRKALNRIEFRQQKALHPFTLHMGVKDQGIPEKLAEYAILMPADNYDAGICNGVFLELSGQGDNMRAPEGKRTLSATIFLEESPVDLGDGALHQAASALVQELETLLPFLKENIEFLDIDRCIDLSRKYQEVVGCKFMIGRKLFTGFQTLSNRTPLKSIILTGDELLGLGFVGEVISGVNAARLAVGGHRK